MIQLIALWLINVAVLVKSAWQHELFWTLLFVSIMALSTYRIAEEWRVRWQ